MIRSILQTLGSVAVASAALLLSPAAGQAQHGGGGHSGGGHSGGGHPGGGHPGGGGSHWSGGGGHWEGGRGYYGGYRSFPYGGYGYGYPRYYDRSYYGNYYSVPDYTVTPDYYDDTAAEPAGTRVVANFRMPAPDAQLWVEGKRVDSQGMTRQFVSPALDPNSEYTYHFEARWNENGQERKTTKTVHVHAGDRITVNFSRPSDSQPTEEEQDRP